VDPYHGAVDLLRTFALLVGSAVIFVGVARAVPEVLRTGSARSVAQRMLSHVALGLEFFVGATILNLILRPTWASVAATALTIAVRKLITLSLARSARVG
jgi:uncharacterized membrane protein